MGTTPRLGIPYIEPADALAIYPAADQAQALAVEDDWFSAWVSWSTAVAGSRYRQVGSIVFVQVDGAYTTTTAVSAQLSTTPLPAGLRPSIQTRAAGYFSGYAGILTVDAAGHLSAVQYSGANRTSVSGIVVYPIS